MYIYIYIYIHLALTNICMQADAWSNWRGGGNHAAVTAPQGSEWLPPWWVPQAASAASQAFLLHSCTAHHDI